MNVYGFTEDETEFFDLHITSDEVAVQRGYQIVLNYADTPELQRRCIDMVKEAADMRFTYTKTLYEYYEADLGDWVEEPSPRWPEREIHFKTADRVVSFPARRRQPVAHRHPPRGRVRGAPAGTAAPTVCSSKRAPSI